MGKGFGIKSEVQLGYILLIIPESNGYAARLDLDIGQMRIANPWIAMILGIHDFVCFLFKLITRQEFHKPTTDSLTNIDESNKKEFIGITNSLEDAQVWKTIKEAKEAIPVYSEFFIDEIKKYKCPRTVMIKRLKQSSDGKLISEVVNGFIITQ